MRLRLGLALAGFALALVFLASAAAFLCRAIELALIEVATPPLAALGAAGAALVIALAVALAGGFLARRRRDRWAPVDADRIAADLGAFLGKQVTSFASAHPKGTLLGSLLTGFAIGADPALRRALVDLLH